MRYVGPNVAKVAALIGDAVRARMLFALLDSTEYSASELAFRSGASLQAASGHLSKLVGGGLLRARSAGRQRLFRLASPEVATAIETLASIAPATPVVSLTQHTTLERLREARSCYDHLAGRLGVSVTDAMIDQHVLTERDGRYDVGASGEAFFRDVGVDLEAARASRRTFARSCLDWTERRPHLAGALGAAMLESARSKGWFERNAAERSLRVTALGRQELERLLGLGWRSMDRCTAGT